MSSDDFLERISKLSPKRLALLALELHEQVEAAGPSGRQPIAVIGLGCRFPGGANDPDAFWEVLREGRDAIREVPPERWDIEAYFDADPDAPAKMSVRHGGFLDRVDGFDAAFFGISPREALTMDPQQRLVLEVAWEALEHAGLSPERLAGSATGMYLGVCNSDHFQRVIERGNASIDAYLASGNAHSVASGRVAYFLGLRGPALSIDTACSSSLVALHVACQSLRSGETRLALAGGVNLMCSPETTIALTKAHMLAPDGRCKTFDAAADGFSRGEGCGMLVLKRLADAQADGDRVLAVIRGSAANQDGRSGGLTVPSGPAQEAVIRAALADAGLAPADIGYVEAHGTGTTLGDPIEVRALGAALGAGRVPGEPLLVGSVKTNIGHLESAAGVAGVIKVVLALQHERLPPHLHFKEPSPHIAWSGIPVRVEAAGREWPRGATPRRAGVSSFGFSGTNAHMIIEEAPAPPAASSACAGSAAPAAARPVHCLPLSARSPQALRDLAQRMAAALVEGKGLTLAEAAHTAGVGRAHFSERVAVVADTAAAARAALNAFVRGEEHPALYRGQAQPGQAAEVVFLFTGQGSQYPGMGQGLYAGSPVFREVIDRCDALLGADAEGRTLRGVLRDGPSDGAPLHDTVWAQPALFAVEYALTRLWHSWGIEPAAVIGHSLGEYVAACVAGVFGLEEGLRLIAERGRLMQALPPGGSMAAVFAPEAAVATAIGTRTDRLAIAAVNAPDSVVVSGDAEALDELLVELAGRDVQGQRLFVSLAAHSPRVDPALDAMEACAQRVTMRAPHVPVAWNLTGGALPTKAPDARYWRRHLREPVRFAEGMRWLHGEGYRNFLEVGPHPTLSALAERSLPTSECRLAASLRRGKDDWEQLMHGLAALYVRGAPIDWAGVDAPHGTRRTTLPTYPFERESFWIPSLPAGSPRPSVAAPLSAGGNALVGVRLPTAAPIFEARLSAQCPAYLDDHRLQGACLVAGPVFAELAQAGAREAFGPAPRVLHDLVIREPLVLHGEGRTVQLHFSAEGVDGDRPFEIHSRALGTDAGDWRLHVSGRLVPHRAAPATAAAVVSIAELQHRLGSSATCDGHYERLAALGIELGPAFRSLVSAHRRDGEALCRIALAEGCAAEPVAWAHPGLLDGALQAVGLTLPLPGQGDDVYLLTGIGRLQLAGPLPAALWCHVRLQPASSERPAEWRAEVRLLGEGGEPLGTIEGVVLRRATHEVLHAAAGSGSEGLFYRLAWEPAPAAPRAAPLLAAPSSFAATVAGRFETFALQHDLAVYEQLLPELDRLSARHGAVALAELGFDDVPGRRFGPDAEAAALGVAAKHRRLFARVLQMLAEDGVLRPAPGGFEVAHRLDRSDPMSRYEPLMRRFGAVDGELRTLRRCGGELARVLRGEQDALELLFPGGSFAEARQLYVESPFARSYNAALGEALTAAIAVLPPTSRLRVLEIGAGTGGTTTYVLPLLPADRTSYTFTDLSPLFLERAAEQFGEHAFVERALLDIERDPSGQGFAPGHYDIVIAANVLHATADLRQALRHVRQLMAPGGVLLLLEGVAPERWVDLTFGLTDGWWRFVDEDLRPDYPLVGRDTWHAVLPSVGFSDVQTVPSHAGDSRARRQQALIVARTPVLARHWHLVGGPPALVHALSRRLQARGDTVGVCAADAFDASLASGGEWVYLGALELAGATRDDPVTPRRCQALACEGPLRWLARLATEGTGARAWLVTAGAHAAGGAAAEDGRWQVPLWGVGRVFALEQPQRWGGLVDLAPGASPDAMAATLLAAFDADDDEDQTAWRDGARMACRLLEAPTPAPAALRLRGDATYMVSGGFGGLGLLVARWMVERGARHLALLGRRPDATLPELRALEALGATLYCLEGDVADASGMDRLLQKLAAEAPPLRGIVHAAAELSAAPITQLSAAQVAGTLRPKLDGTLVLERLAERERVDFLVLFSSTTALLGASGLAHYAAANLFLDASAEQARRAGRPVLSVNWGTWEAMRLASAESRQGFRQAGLEPMPAADALDALARLLGSDVAQGVVARIDWQALKPVHEARRSRPLLRHLGRPPSSARPAALAQPQSDRGASALAHRLTNAPASARRDVLIDFVQQEAAAVLGWQDRGPLPLGTGLFDLGMDSLMAVELKRRLERGVGHSLPATLTFNYPNVGALARFFEAELSQRAASPPAPATSAQGGASNAASAVPDDRPLEALSEEQLEARLLACLERVQ